MHCNLNEFRHITILQILPKDGDLGELINLRPMALLLIFSKLFSELIYNHITTHPLIISLGINTTLLLAYVSRTLCYTQRWYLSNIMSSTYNYGCSTWICVKIFDTIDHPVLIEALQSNGLPDAYTALLFLSVILFNCILDIAFIYGVAPIEMEGYLSLTDLHV